MPESPGSEGEELVTVSLSSGGDAVPDTVGVLSVEVLKRVNMIPTARIVLDDGDMPAKDFPLSASSTFAPGAEVRIDAGYGSDEDTIFEGIVVRHGVSVSGENASRLVIECRDKAVAMTVGRRNANFVDLADSAIISQLVKAYPGLTADVETTQAKHPELVQYYCTDWDFVLSRAEVNGLLVIVDAGAVSVRAPDVSGSPRLQVTYGEDLMEFHADMDVRSQHREVMGVSWDPAKQEVVSRPASPTSLNRQGDLDGSKLAAVLGVDSFRLQTAASLDSSAMDAWVRAQQVKAALARIRGRMRFQGSATAAVGTLIGLDGMGARFDGEVFVSAVRHELVEGRWVTEVEFGMAPEWFAEVADVVAPPASGWTPAAQGLQIGVVSQLEENPQGEPMIQVRVPVMEAERPGVWARLAHPHASSGFGSFFVPEVGDEVVLGYVADDPSHPVVLGSLYSSMRKPPYEITKQNDVKGIVTRSELRIELDEEKKVVTVATPGGNTVVLDDDAQSIVLQDQHGNKVECGPDGITLDSPKDIKLTATGKVSIDATGEISLASKADVKTSGMNVSHEAQVGFAAKGNATAEVSASGQTTVKGAMVMIN